MEHKKHKHNGEKKNGAAPHTGETECGSRPAGQDHSSLNRPSGDKCDANNECVCEEGAPSAAAKSAEKKAEKKAPDYYEQLLCVKADFENYRKRVEKEKPEFVKFGKAEILLRLLPLYDMLLQAHLHISKVQAGGKEEAGNTQDIAKGLEMIFREFSKVFEAEGIRPMEVVGKPYDPMASEIIGIDEGTVENDGLVTEEFQKGFYYGDKVLRPARVKIAKVKAPATGSAAGGEKKEGAGGEGSEL